jgi:hypothetical protein
MQDQGDVICNCHAVITNIDVSRTDEAAWCEMRGVPLRTVAGRLESMIINVFEAVLAAMKGAASMALLDIGATSIKGANCLISSKVLSRNACSLRAPHRVRYCNTYGTSHTRHDVIIVSSII